MERDILVHGENLSHEKFALPPHAFGIVPFWFWNGEMSYDEIEYQLREFQKKGIPAIYIHARFGVREELGYMNDDWLDRCRFTIEKAAELGMQTWVYDEYNWPSGTCGQTLMQDHPEMTSVYLELVQTEMPGQYFMFMEGTDSRYNDMEQSEPVYACAIRTEDLKNGRFETVDLMPSLSFDKVITWEAPKGPWKVCYFIERKSSWYSDVLNPETTRTFLQYTHEKYKEHLGQEDFSKVKGFFTDEPAMFYFESAKDNFCIPWTKNMLGIFRERNGYDLRKNLLKLFYDCGGDTEQVRYDFWSTLSDQYDKSYFQEIHDWCQKNNVIFTGHLLYEESLRMHGRVDGNLFTHLRQFDMTGIDHLYPRIGTREMENEHVALKIASSAAHQNGSVRLCCESMGGSYWDCTMERMKWIADWEYVLGVNQFIPHGFHYSIEGERKRDWPPSMSYQFTWWKHYGLFNDYVSRMGYLFSGGDHVAKLAILYPMSSIWANYMPNQRTKTGQTIEDEFAFLTDRLLRLHMDFDYLDEDVLNHECKIQDGRISIRGEVYEALFLPPLTHLKAETYDSLETFVHSGGKVLAEALLPYACVEGQAGDIQTRMQALFGKDPLEVKQSFLREKADPLTISEKKLERGKTVFISGQGFKRDPDEKNRMKVLDAALRTCLVPEIEISSEEVFYLHRRKDGRDLFFLVNPVDAACDVQISWVGEHSLEKWDLENGNISPVLVYRTENGKTHLTAHMEPYGSALYVFGEQAPGWHLCAVPENVVAHKVCLDEQGAGKICYLSRAENEGEVKISSGTAQRTAAVPAEPVLPPISLSSPFAFSMEGPNAMNTDHWRVAVSHPGENVQEILSGKTDASWFPMHMGAWALQLPNEKEEPVYPADLWYVTTLRAEYIPDDLSLVIDGFKGSSYELYLNGTRVSETPVRSRLDAEMKEVPVSRYFRIGENVVVVKLTVRSRSDGMTDLLKILGTFGVDSREGIDVMTRPPKTMAPGDFTKNLLPCFSGTGWYQQHITLSAEQVCRQLFLECDVGHDVLEVRVNGKKAGVRLWKPYTVDISPYVQEGDNVVEIGVVNTLMNMLESSHTPSGLFSAKIVPWNRCEISFAKKGSAHENSD